MTGGQERGGNDEHQVMAKEGLTAAATSSQEFAAFLQAEMRRNERIIKTLNLKMQ
jgi:tripartite-type tricarboxylate transporter receptor subunit TctC